MPLRGTCAHPSPRAVRRAASAAAAKRVRGGSRTSCEHPGGDAREHSGSPLPPPEQAGQEPESERDDELQRDEQSVHESPADAWLDADVDDRPARTPMDEERE
jgi:hypothetical protein